MATEALKGTTVLVTGGAGGLGKAIAKGYLAAGANVAVCDIDEGRLAETRGELEGTGRFLAAWVDVTDEEAVAGFVGEVAARFGRLDVLVNNAGRMDTFQGVDAMARQTWDAVVGLNLTGAFLCMKAAAGAMLRQEPLDGFYRGQIVQVGSDAAARGHQAGAAYTASKHAVAGLVRQTASFYGDDGIYACQINAGAMPATNIAEGLASLGGADQAAFAKTTGTTFRLDKDAIDPEDVARYCVFLADRKIARGANGSCISFNNNWPKA